ncbi:MAG: hypothetical protein R3208_19225, partial [Ketobacteraceae bacterium]|nr:hypothetical protein [Ketobacteraceae bacterium]
QERHFYFTASGDSVGVITAESGTSGSLFQNLISFPTGRDNLRQGSVDLMNLLASLGDMDVDGVANGPDFDTSRVYFIGHSLGAVNGLPFLTVNNLTADTTGQPKVKAAAVLNSGGFVTELLLNSPSPAFGAPRILAGLAAAGLTQGDSDLEVFMNVLQGILDSGDSMNFAESLGDGDMSVLLTEIVGGDPVNVYPGERFVDPLPAGGAICTEEDVEQEGCVTEVTPSDQTVPNAADQDVWGVAPLSNAYDAPGSGKNAGDPWMINGQAISVVPLTGTPLAGTEPMVNLLGAAITAEASASNGKLISVTRFTRGDHANPITGGVTEATDSDGNPVVGNKFSSERVFSEMTVQIGSLFATHPSGTPSVTVSDGCVIEDSASNDRSATSGCPLGEFQ